MTYAAGDPADHALARRLAGDAGALLMALRESWAGEPDGLRDAGDARSHAYLAEQLRLERPTDAVLSEEGTEDLGRLRADRVWIVDPLDGTREFGEAGRRDWAVHVALWERGRLVAGAVARPAIGDVIATDAPPPRPTGISPAIRVAVSRTRPPSFSQALAERLDAVLVPMGSAGIKAMAVVDGTVDAYVHDGGQHEWDSAVPVAVALAAGLHASRLDGSPLVYNQPDPSVPDLYICGPELAGTLLAAFAGPYRDA